jgi:hypothetical protein
MTNDLAVTIGDVHPLYDRWRCLSSGKTVASSFPKYGQDHDCEVNSSLLHVQVASEDKDHFSRTSTFSKTREFRRGYRVYFYFARSSRSCGQAWFSGSITLQSLLILGYPKELTREETSKNKENKDLLAPTGRM